MGNFFSITKMPRTCELEAWSPPVSVDLLDDMTKEELLEFRAFRDWLRTLKASLALQRFEDHALHKSPYKLKHIQCQATDRTYTEPKRILFLKLQVTVENDLGERLPGAVFLRGGSVAMLMILRMEGAYDERWVIMTEQPRIAAGSLSFVEIPAGMLDDSSKFSGAAAREIEEEVGYKLEGKDLIDMTKLAMQHQKTEQDLRVAVYPSPGACDEFIAIFFWQQTVSRARLEDLNGRLTGRRAEQEKIRLKLIPYNQLLDHGGRDAKTLAAWSLYEYLRKTGKHPELD